ncbi:guanine nucleotide-binding protein alpha-3 subunit [Reticulomyxa filosa]|uniref:Guanine nucleotide-binding protein alpha-3 subunit n=1 Tax=Reticulomyxa filosa TaxID=46433 RepID=X6MW84_RETFI|nr:guanine nucleotide-binding protein alpha-3 subunit [Reticulomyxa filosa]ETO17866.1 guanine nucleotide-binding protein alpha-3 subunit [Reticulomyxa filosa]|eukprot:ETN99806.1 guanine nucleotide-binding protein alpha-3 subunit [Reticulomyxa filosa]
MKTTELILFLNKRDLFEEQLRVTPLSVCFTAAAGWYAFALHFPCCLICDCNNTQIHREEEQWEGENYKYIDDNKEADKIHFESCYEQAVSFITRLFEVRNAVPGRSLFAHVTCATDVNNVKLAFWHVQKMVIRSNLRKVGVMT